jgi:hypothetical protein
MTYGEMVSNMNTRVISGLKRAREAGGKAVHHEA